MENLYLLQTRCSDEMLGLLPPAEAAAYLEAQVADLDRSVEQTAASIVIEHGNPCQMRRFKRRPFRVVSRLMSEGFLPPEVEELTVSEPTVPEPRTAATDTNQQA